MALPLSRRFAALATLLAVVVIVHGSLWPYAFDHPHDGTSPLDALFKSWAARPSSLGDILGNVLFYMPLGLFGVLACPAGRFGAVVLGAVILSVCMELAQFYDADRVTSLWDVASNTTGATVGAIAGLAIGTRPRIPLLRDMLSHPVPAFLLIAMLGYRLVPYVPVIDLHKYWNALKPLVIGPWPAPEEVFRYLAVWLTSAELVAQIFGPLLSLILFPLLAGFVLGAKVLIYASVVTRPDVLAAALVALLFWPILHRSAGRTAFVAVVLLGDVVIERLAPFSFLPIARPFGWLPFRAFLGGSLVVNTAALFEKLFLYGSAIWLLQRSLLRGWAATAFVAAILFATSLAETRLPDRSGEITDTLIALLAAGLVGVLEAGTANRELQAEPHAYRFKHRG